MMPANQNMKVCFTGGVLLNSDQVRSIFLHQLKDKCPEAEVISAEIDPVAGAIAMARRTYAKPSGHSAAKPVVQP